MISHLQQALTFSIHTIFNLYITILLMRFFLQIARADFYNPLSQFIVKATNPLLVPLRRIIPGIAGIDLASIILLIILQITENSLLLLINNYAALLNFAALPGLIVWALGELIDLALVSYLFIIFVLAILSWIPISGYNAVIILILQLASPILKTIRKYHPNTGSIDFSPMIAMFFLILMRILISTPLIQLGKQWL